MQWERPLDLREAAYRLDSTDDEWLCGMAEQMAGIREPVGVGAGAFSVAGGIDSKGRTVVVDVPLSASDSGFSCSGGGRPLRFPD